MRLVVPLVAALVLAGCAQPEAEPDAAPVDNVITDPSDYSYIEPGTDGSGYHIHDYWGGQESLQVMEQTQTVGSDNCSSCVPNPIFRFRPDEGATVPQGTSNVSVTITWKENGNADYGGAELWIKTASDIDPVHVADIESGDTVVVASTNEQNDPPHHILSLWEFWFMTKERPNGDGSTFGGEVTMTANVERGLEIPPWPPHPDHWQGASELQVLEESRTVGGQTHMEIAALGTDTTNCSFGDCLGFHRLTDGMIVPWDAQQVELRLDYDTGSMPNLGVWFHGADTWALEALSPEATEATGESFVIDLVPTMGDSPYAKQSLWEFYVDADNPGPVTHYTGGYTLTVTAVRG